MKKVAVISSVWLLGACGTEPPPLSDPDSFISATPPADIGRDAQAASLQEAAMFAWQHHMYIYRAQLACQARRARTSIEMDQLFINQLFAGAAPRNSETNGAPGLVRYNVKVNDVAYAYFTEPASSLWKQGASYASATKNYLAVSIGDQPYCATPGAP